MDKGSQITKPELSTVGKVEILGRRSCSATQFSGFADP